MINPQARQVKSPNFYSREGAEVECVVIHYISLPPGEFSSEWVERFFQNRLDPKTHPYFETIYTMRVSAHFLIARDGEVVQFVDTEEAAWHAGPSSWRGREGVNLFSVGVELIGDGETPFEEAQYTALKELLTWIRAAYPKTALSGAIVGHEEIAPGRKFDPGPCFDWSRFR